MSLVREPEATPPRRVVELLLKIPGGCLAIAIVLLGATASASESDPIRAIVRKAKEQRNIPSVSVAVSRGGELIFNEARGFADVEGKTKATTASIYQIGSISKQFTAAGVMRLVERGQLKLDDRVSAFFSDAHPSWSDVRVSHLLHQTSGIREFFTIPEVGRALTDLTRPSDELLRYILREPLGFQPGERWSYSNSNYTLLASIIEKISGVPYEQYLAREFFEPLALTSIHACESKPTRANLAKGYSVRDGKIASAAIENMNWARGDGGLCANAGDLVRWSRALASGEVVAPHSYQQMISSTPTLDGIRASYGFGLSLVPLDGRIPKVSHNGAIGGFSAALAFYPEHDLAIAILTNRSRLSPQVMEKEIARALLDLPLPRFAGKPLTPAARRRYAGIYEIGLTEFEIRIVSRGSVLRIEASPPAPTSDLRHLSDGRFVAADDPHAVELQFSGDPGAPADRLQLMMAGMHWYGRRVPERK